jgi:hypothetical protein
VPKPKCLPLSHFSKCSVWPIVSGIGPKIGLLQKKHRNIQMKLLIMCPLIILDMFYKLSRFIIKLKLLVLVWEELSSATAIRLPIYSIIYPIELPILHGSITFAKGRLGLGSGLNPLSMGHPCIDVKIIFCPPTVSTSLTLHHPMPCTMSL